MAYIQVHAGVAANIEIADGIFDMRLRASEISQMARPGQFVHIYCEGKTLRRPISICDMYPEVGVIRLVYRIVGEGTEWLSNVQAGDRLDILGPLGNGFELEDFGKPVLAVGGGIGVPPLLGAAASGIDCDAVLGFRTKSAVILQEDFAKVCGKLFAATDDGSFGYRGLVTDIVERELENRDYGLMIACGPTVMLRAVAAIAAERGIPCKISLEERMACGIGACLGCACALVRDDGTEYYGHVCKDGPVFDSKEVLL